MHKQFWSTRPGPAESRLTARRRGSSATIQQLMTFDEALTALLALVGERVEVHVMDAGETPHLVATFGGRLQARLLDDRGRAERHGSHLRPP